ncbi:MAG TPA: trypsin-like serine protease [Microvirga sp.]|jgi:V8-like Glu-specific endopeptidase|nr:trypsin-like serine protease [Microvirga sp.]
MSKALESVSFTPVAPADSRETAALMATEGAAGKAEASSSVTAEEFLVHGKRSDPLPKTAVRVGPESIIGKDDRILIADSHKYPWRRIAGLILYPSPPMSGTYIGTGWFIGPKTLLTAGHCVYSKTDFGGQVGSVEVSPGRFGSKFPHGTVKAARFSTLKVWKETGNPDYDIGCIHLDEPLGEQVGWFKIASLPDADLANRLVNISGYPADKGGTKQYFHANRVRNIAPRRISYDIDTYGGQSGSPIWVQDAPGDEPVAIGVHAYGVGSNDPFNSGPRLLPEVILTIQEWLKADGG